MKVQGKGNMFSVYDFMFNTGAFSTKNAVHVVFCRMISEFSEHKDEVLSLCKYLKFEGKGQRDTPCTDVLGLQ